MPFKWILPPLKNLLQLFEGFVRDPLPNIKFIEPPIHAMATKFTNIDFAKIDGLDLVGFEALFTTRPSGFWSYFPMTTH
ncbi:hypothetical protein M0R45_022835 [Rubus argutus]|uniref:Uncharacterized protein n=1 Tax=Rubus argutus TaxID=59490 RepID=A0AAW1XGU1_RUBAR